MFHIDRQTHTNNITHTHRHIKELHSPRRVFCVACLSIPPPPPNTHLTQPPFYLNSTVPSALYAKRRISALSLNTLLFIFQHFRVVSLLSSFFFFFLSRNHHPLDAVTSSDTNAQNAPSFHGRNNENTYTGGFILACHVVAHHHECGNCRRLVPTLGRDFQGGTNEDLGW